LFVMPPTPNRTDSHATHVVSSAAQSTKAHTHLTTLYKTEQEMARSRSRLPPRKRARRSRSRSHSLSPDADGRIVRRKSSEQRRCRESFFGVVEPCIAIVCIADAAA
jgi:hypothetical protein